MNTPEAGIVPLLNISRQVTGVAPNVGFQPNMPLRFFNDSTITSETIRPGAILSTDQRATEIPAWYGDCGRSDNENHQRGAVNMLPNVGPIIPNDMHQQQRRTSQPSYTRQSEISKVEPSPNVTRSYANIAKRATKDAAHIHSAPLSPYHMDNRNTSKGHGGVSSYRANHFDDSKNRGAINSAYLHTNFKETWNDRVKPKNIDEHLKKIKEKVKKMVLTMNPASPGINLDKTRYFVIKTYSEDDVHRSIKYKIWCSTPYGNTTLNKTFENTKRSGGNLLLFFSVNGSGHFCGVAEMISTVNESKKTLVWSLETWKGNFFVKWLYVKDVPNVQLRHLSTKFFNHKTRREEVKPITNVRDATEIVSERCAGGSYKDDTGFQALKVIMDYKGSLSIFDDYVYYEKRELKQIG